MTRAPLLPVRNGRKPSPGSPLEGNAHDRLLAALVALVARDGYAELTVERLQVRAGVSRASFYQYFTNVEDCFSSAYREHAEQLTRELDAAADASEDRELAVLRALVDAALGRPDVARLLMLEGLAAGPAGLRERDVLIARIALAMTGSAGRVRKIDLPAAVLIGAVFSHRYLGTLLEVGLVERDPRKRHYRRVQVEAGDGGPRSARPGR